MRPSRVLLVALAACAPAAPAVHQSPLAADTIEPLFPCSGAPAGLADAGLYDINQLVWFGPAHPTPGQELYLTAGIDVEPGMTAPTGTLQVTTSTGQSQSVPMATWCTEGGGAEQFLGASLGAYPGGTTVSAQVVLSDGMTLPGGDAGYVLQVGVPPALTWVGATEPAYALPLLGSAGLPPDDVVVPPDFPIAGNDLTILTQTYPERAASAVTLFWANADYSATGSASMPLAGDGAGAYGDNDQFRAVIPAAALQAGQTVHYWVEAQDAQGSVLWDSQGGANYTLVPRALTVGWAGNLGSFDAQGGPVEFYRVGQLFNADLSTTIGCLEDGPDDYWVQAIQVYVPGLTDQGYTGALQQVASGLIRADLWTDMQPSGWGPIAMTCQPGPGNNYACALPLENFPEGGSCLPGGVTMPAGEYQYKVRFSVDDGSTWYWVGTADGNGGGGNLNVDYQPSCPFASNPDPTSC